MFYGLSRVRGRLTLPVLVRHDCRRLSLETRAGLAPSFTLARCFWRSTSTRSASGSSRRRSSSATRRLRAGDQWPPSGLTRDAHRGAHALRLAGKRAGAAQCARAWRDSLCGGGLITTEPLSLDNGRRGPRSPVGSVVRWPMERVGAQLPNARLVRINPNHAEVPSELGERALAIACGAAEPLAAVHATDDSSAYLFCT